MGRTFNHSPAYPQSSLLGRSVRRDGMTTSVLAGNRVRGVSHRHRLQRTEFRSGNGAVVSKNMSLSERKGRRMRDHEITSHGRTINKYQGMCGSRYSTESGHQNGPCCTEGLRQESDTCQDMAVAAVRLMQAEWSERVASQKERLLLCETTGQAVAAVSTAMS